MGIEALIPTLFAFKVGVALAFGAHQIALCKR